MPPEYLFSITVNAKDREEARRTGELLSSIQGVAGVKNLGQKGELIGADLKEQVERGDVNFGSVLRILRERRDLDQVRLAKLACLTREHVCRIERGLASRPRVSTVERLASALGLNLKDTSYLISLRSLGQK